MFFPEKEEGAGTAQSVWLLFLEKVKNFSLFYGIQTDRKAHCLLPGWDWKPFFQGHSGGNVKLIIHLCLVPRSGMLERYLHFTVRLHGEFY
jgi:hypothetical protein